MTKPKSPEGFWVYPKSFPPYYVAKPREGFPLFKRAKGFSSTTEARNRQIAAQRKAGETLEAIGKKHGLTRERVRQILFITNKLGW